MDTESDQAKLFVGGISRETSEEILRGHFSKYGTVLGSVIARERGTKNSRGFGFVLFSDPSSADEALKDAHVIAGRSVEVKKAIPRSEQHQNQQQQQLQHYPTEQQNSRTGNSGEIAIHFRTKKIFVGGLSANLTEEEFKKYFERFGRIIDVVVMHDNMTNRPRGFGFVTYDSDQSVENVMQKTFHELNGRLVEVKRAVPKEGINSSSCGYNTRFGSGKVSTCKIFQSGNYPLYSPAYGTPAYAPLPGYGGVGGYMSGPGMVGGQYPMVLYGKYGYGVTPTAPRGPWYGPMVIGAGPCPVPYGYASFFPTYMNGGFGTMGSAAGGYGGIIVPGMDGKLSQVLGGSGRLLANAAPSHMEGVKLDVNSMGFRGRNDSGSSEQNQKDLDGRFTPLPVGISR